MKLRTPYIKSDNVYLGTTAISDSESRLALRIFDEREINELLKRINNWERAIDLLATSTIAHGLVDRKRDEHEREVMEFLNEMRK